MDHRAPVDENERPPGGDLGASPREPPPRGSAMHEAHGPGRSSRRSGVHLSFVIFRQAAGRTAAVR
jgi:hypothetical protein